MNKGDVCWHAGPGEGGAHVCLTGTNTPQGHGAEGCNGCLRTCHVSNTEAILSYLKPTFVCDLAISIELNFNFVFWYYSCLSLLSYLYLVA